MNIRLQTRHTLTFLGLLALVLAVLSGALLLQFRTLTSEMQESSSDAMGTTLLEQASESGLALGTFLATALRAPIYQLDFASIGRLAESALNQPNVAYVYVFDIEGRVVHDGTEALESYGLLLQDPEIELALKSAQSATTFDEVLLHVSVPIVIGSQVHGGVRIGISTDDIRSEIASGASLLKGIGDSGFARLLLATLSITVLLILVGIVISILLARNLVQPIRLLSDLARRIGRGEYDVDVPITRRDEVGDLARSFKEMAEELARAAHRNALLATFVEHVGDAIEVINTDAEIEYTNPAHERITGYSLAEAIGRTPAELHRPEVHDPAFYDRIWETTESGQVWKGSILGQRKDGSLWHQESTISPVRNEKGEITHYIAIKRDITSDIEHRQALADSEQRFKDYAESSSDWLWETDEEFRFVEFTGNKENLTGYTAEDAAGKTRWELFGVDPEADENWGRYKADLEAQRPFRDFRFEYHRSDDRIFHFSVSGKPIFDEDGQFKGHRGTASDMTAEVEAGRALMDSEQRFRDYAESASDWFWELDEDLEFTWFSGTEADIGGWSFETALGKTRWDLYKVDPDTDEDWGRHKAELEARLPFRDFRYEIPHADQTYYVSVSGKPVFNQDGDFKGYRGAAIDMTPQVKADRALRESEQRFRDYAEAASDWFWEMDEDLRFSSFTGNEPDIGGRPPSDAIGKTRWELFDADPDVDEHWKRHRDDLEARRPFRDFRYEFRGTDDRTNYLSASGKPAFDEDGRFTGYRGTACNMTAEVESEIAMRRSEEQLVNIAANLPGRVFRRVLHSDGSISFPYVSSKYEDPSTRPPDRRLTERSEILEHIDPADWEMWEDSLRRSAENLEPYDIEYRRNRPHEDTVWIRVIGRPHKRENGDIVWDSISLDVTDRKAAESALEESERTRAAILEAIPDALFSHDRNGLILDYLPSSSDYEPLMPPEEFLGRTIREIMPADLAEKAMACIERAIDTGESQSLEYPLTKKGQLHFHEARYVVSGKDRVLGVIRDVTDRKRAEDDLRVSETRFRRLVENAADTFLLYDLEGIIVDANRHAVDTLGYTRMELLSLSLDNIVVDFDAENSLATGKIMRPEIH